MVVHAVVVNVFRLGEANEYCDSCTIWNTVVWIQLFATVVAFVHVSECMPALLLLPVCPGSNISSSHSAVATAAQVSTSTDMQYTLVEISSFFVQDVALMCE